MILEESKKISVPNVLEGPRRGLSRFFGPSPEGDVRMLPPTLEQWLKG